MWNEDVFCWDSMLVSIQRRGKEEKGKRDACELEERAGSDVICSYSVLTKLLGYGIFNLGH